MPRPLVAAVLAASALFTAIARSSPALRFDLGTARAANGFVAVTPDTVYSETRGYGFEAGVGIQAVDRGGNDALRGDFVTSERPFHFTAHVPAEGNYRVTVTLGDPAGESRTTVKAELRRLMVAGAVTAKGEVRRETFVVNTRTPVIAASGQIKAGQVRLKAPRETVQEAWAWDQALTLEFGDTRPAVAAIEIEPVTVATIFLLGDSTVCDQSKEPYNSWGQMLTRFFRPDVAIANHGESGETYRDSLARRRLDKILSVMEPGDWLLMQFGHNDQKQLANASGGPFTTYLAEIRTHVEQVRGRGGHPLILSPMERRGFDAAGKVKSSLGDYAAAARQAAEELKVPFIDLNAMSKVLYEALGPERSALAFAAPGGKVDNTHHNNFGSYQLARCIVQALRDQRLPLADFIRDDVAPFDPARPDNPDTLRIAPSGEFTNQRPLGDEGNR